MRYIAQILRTEALTVEVEALHEEEAKDLILNGDYNAIAFNPIEEKTVTIIKIKEEEEQI